MIYAGHLAGTHPDVTYCLDPMIQAKRFFEQLLLIENKQTLGPLGVGNTHHIGTNNLIFRHIFIIHVCSYDTYHNSSTLYVT